MTTPSNAGGDLCTVEGNPHKRLLSRWRTTFCANKDHESTWMNGAAPVRYGNDRLQEYSLPDITRGYDVGKGRCAPFCYIVARPRKQRKLQVRQREVWPSSSRSNSSGMRTQICRGQSSMRRAITRGHQGTHAPSDIPIFRL